MFVRNCSVRRSENPCLSSYQLVRQNLGSFDYKYENKGRMDSINDKQQLNVFEDGSMKQSNSIHIIDELLRYKKLY